MKNIRLLGKDSRLYKGRLYSDFISYSCYTRQIVLNLSGIIDIFQYYGQIEVSAHFTG